MKEFFQKLWQQLQQLGNAIRGVVNYFISGKFWADCKEFFRQLPRRLGNMGCWLWDAIKGVVNYYASGEFWTDCKETGKFIEKIKKDFIPACTTFLGIVFEGKKARPVSLKKRLLKLPGDSNLDSLLFRALLGGVYIGILIGSVATYASDSPLLLLATFLVLVLLTLPVLIYQMEDFALGMKGELAVAEKLAERENFVRGNEVLWKSFHSFFIPRKYGDPQYGDIDHIVVCTHGVFCLETKNPRRKKIKINPDTGETSPVKNETAPVENGKIWECPTGQARGNAGRLRDFLNEKGASFVEFVVPVVFLVDVFIPDGEIYVTEKLIVGNSRSIGYAFKTFADKFGEERKLTPEQFRQICDILDKENRSDPEEQPPPD